MRQNQKVAIMTWYTYQNYGSALQASALYHVIQRMGYEPDFIDYTPKGNVRDSVHSTFSERLIKRIKAKLDPVYVSAERSVRFENYMKTRTTCSAKCNSYPELHDLNNRYNAFICGSDQVWAPNCYDSKYFLDFVDDTEKMIAYAPSIGLPDVENDTVRSRMADHIARFKHLSIREQQGADLIKRMTGQTAKVTLDPTLLLESSEWDSYADVPCTRFLPAESGYSSLQSGTC